MLHRFLACSLLGLTIGCASEMAAPSDAPLAATKFWEGGATVRWNAIAREETRSGTLNIVAGTRMLTYLSLTQYQAAAAAKQAHDRGEHSSVSAAVGAASAALLSAAPFFPARAAFFEEQLDLQEAASPWPGEAQDDFAAGEAIGRDVAATVIARAAGDGFTPSNDGVTVPQCPGCWFSAPGALPAFPRLREMHPFLLTSSDQFRPGPPPAFGSPAFLSALTEVRQFSDTRTPAQDASAKFWALPNGYAVIPAYNYQIAAEQIVKFHLNELRAAHVMALMGLAIHGRVHRLPRCEVHVLAAAPIAGGPGDHAQRAATQPPIVSIEPCVHHRSVHGSAGPALPE